MTTMKEKCKDTRALLIKSGASSVNWDLKGLILKSWNLICRRVRGIKPELNMTLWIGLVLNYRVSEDYLTLFFSLKQRTFEQSGFGGRETFTQADMIFKSALTQSVQTWPASQQALDQRLRQTEKMLPPFPYDVTPYEQTRILVDVNFFEVWADVLVAGGWARDELKESSFALVQWKSRPRDGEFARGRSAGNDSDDRTEERWVLVEEYVPREYREELRDGKVRLFCITLLLS